MVRSWNQLVGSAVELWAVLPSAPNSPSWSDPMERLRAIGEAISPTGLEEGRGMAIKAR